MIHSSRQLKDLIRNLSKSTGVDTYILMRQYMMERFLERVSKSQYRNNFIIKGGILVASLLGVNQRTTMDIDTTIKGFTVTISEIQKLIEDIISIPIDDDVVFYHCFRKNTPASH
jgi:predicted nucleotidyltransferase component of viral defense system